MESIPVCDIVMDGNELEYINDAVKSKWISSSGKYVQRFEEEFSRICGMKFGVSTTNGTTALHLALVSLGIGKQDEVIIPAFTMSASAFAVCYTGAVPVFVDADAQTWNINPDLIEEKITSKTKAIMTVSVFGQPSNMQHIREIADKYNLFLIEDSAEAHGAEYLGKKLAEYADITAYSFYANKIITVGEGGMIVTNSRKLYDSSRYYRNMCFSVDGERNYLHQDIGFNYRMSNIHAAIGLAQVEKSQDYINMRINNGKLYNNKLSQIPGITLQKCLHGALHTHWMNAIIVDKDVYGKNRDELMAHLTENNIETRLLFNGMHRQPSLLKFGCDCRSSFPVSDWLSDNGFYLPSGSNITFQQIEYICEKIYSFKG